MNIRIAVFFALLLTTVGCASNNAAVTPPSNVGQQVEQANLPSPPRQVPGVEEYVWEAPMVDVVDVPPGLDPEGHYYRPGHQEVVEIRQGRWRYYKPAQK